MSHKSPSSSPPLPKRTDRRMSNCESFGPPLDYSFKSLTSIEGLANEKPRRGVKSYKRNKAGRYSCTSLRLNNNYLTSISGIHGIANELLEFPEKLTWLDLSFNRLASIPTELSAFINLKIVYLHGNQLADLPSVLRPLKMLTELYSLTVHGNPLEERRGYRNKIILNLPNLKSLDFNNVTVADRKRLQSLQHKKKE
ncbi:leucine-rich repeat-containing protein 51-like [Cimex lectularius]|uniref:Leucine-rich repeat-containing protein 51 n=1 Tax=Cimex lectularius TaxID=79782 RepID=A0A8I6RZ04_CIMLE|nr:leucine-rich repeat-containing protein 51-like [Cimex lectularius]XP_014254243.1 leucine-rich repeat-containing protein 51-like [Cimex lectularius]XP_014254244.1 leucine-rich repeat-containing protein 51-like [Cimex lectularius]